MSSFLLALVCGLVASIGLVSLATFERRGRVRVREDRPELAPPRSAWGGGLEYPPARARSARALAGFARLVRSRTGIADHQVLLRAAARVVGSTSLALGLALLPVAGSWGGQSGPPLVVVDLDQGLLALGFVLLMVAFARVAVGLSERSPWSRIGSAQQASRSIAGVALLAIVLAPLAIDSQSLRLHDIVLDQQRALEPFGWITTRIAADWAIPLSRFTLPAWNVFAQPLTALLFLPAIALWTTSPRVDDPTTGAIDVAGLGLDADPSDLYWTRVDARLSNVLAGGLFVTLFLGAGGLPFFDVDRFLGALAPFVGQGLPELLVTAIYVGSFAIKLVLVLAISQRLGRAAAGARDDRALRLATRRLMPVAWANLLLIAGLALFFDRLAGGVAP